MRTSYLSLVALLPVLASACASSSAEPQTEPTDSAAPATDMPSADPTATADTTSTPTATPTAAPADPPKPDRNQMLTEAKNAVGAIARGAAGSYERERVGGGHAVCKSATPVPAKVPAAGERYQSTDADWASGDETTGWKCLKYALVKPAFGQYTFTWGSTPKLAARKKMTGDAQSFEACVELDLEAGGKTSLVCLTGKVDPKTKTVKINTEMQVDEE